MPFNPEIHNRRSIRLKNFDYSQNGAYFVTLCVNQRVCLFGEILNGTMVLNEIGRIVHCVWENIETNRNVQLDAFVIMPNHFHAILHIISADLHGNQGEAGETFASPLPEFKMFPFGTVPGSFNAIIQNFKSVTSRRINRFNNTPGVQVWQRNYYERVIRNELELTRAREYIIHNPLKWDLDKENPNSSN